MWTWAAAWRLWLEVWWNRQVCIMTMVVIFAAVRRGSSIHKFGPPTMHLQLHQNFAAVRYWPLRQSMWAQCTANSSADLLTLYCIWYHFEVSEVIIPLSSTITNSVSILLDIRLPSNLSRQSLIKITIWKFTPCILMVARRCMYTQHNGDHSNGKDLVAQLKRWAVITVTLDNN